MALHAIAVILVAIEAGDIDQSSVTASFQLFSISTHIMNKCTQCCFHSQRDENGSKPEDIGEPGILYYCRHTNSQTIQLVLKDGICLLLFVLWKKTWQDNTGGRKLILLFIVRSMHLMCEKKSFLLQQLQIELCGICQCTTL